MHFKAKNKTSGSDGLVEELLSVVAQVWFTYWSFN